MSFLAPLFLVGALAVALPILFHLIRRTSKDKTLFSSLMFLLPTPPRVTRKSRLENILLLILRCLVLCLLALGFARPFVQKAFQSNLQAGQGKRIAILVDSSASMRRANLWADARAKAEEVLKKTSPADQVALFTFDRQFNRLVSFEQWSAMGAGERVTLAAKRLADTSPGWASTHLGNALISTAEALQDLEGSDKQQPQLRSKQIVLISDLQEGSRLDALQGYEWPKETELIIEPLKPKKPTNAGLQLVTDLDESDKKAADARPRVRVSNSADAKREQFQVGWTRSGEKGFAGKAVDVYVPPGQSRVVMSPELPPGVAPDRLVLKGDDDDFDNTVYVVPLEAARTKILLLSNDSEKDTAQPPYFVRRAFQETRRQIVQVLTHKADGPLLPTDTEGVPLIIASDALPEEQVKTLRRLLNEGKSMVFMLKTPAGAQTIARLLEIDKLPAEEATTSSYAMLGEIDFQHPLFAPFADPRFSDFTKIHFWKHRRLATNGIPAARVLARFDNGDAAFIQVPVGKGTLLVLTSGWHPADSQLALSSKFVPLLYSLLEQSGGITSRPLQYLVGDMVSLAETNATHTLTVSKPDDSKVELAKSGAFSQTDLPGIYTATSNTKHQTPNSNPQRFAVNLDSTESKTAPLSLEELERLGVPIKLNAREQAKQSEIKKRLADADLESRQKLWRWLVVAALAVLLIESWLAGWLTKRAAVATGN